MRCGSLPGSVSAMAARGSPLPVTRIARYTYERPDSGSRMQPPRQVAAPPNGSISVGWLWVSFLNITSHSSLRPSTSTGTTMLAALISADSSRSASSPCRLASFIASVATSIRHSGFFAAP